MTNKDRKRNKDSKRQAIRNARKAKGVQRVLMGAVA